VVVCVLVVCAVVVCAIVVCAVDVDALLAATVEAMPTDVGTTATRLLVDVPTLSLALALVLLLVLGVVALETAAVEKSAGRVTECERAQDSGERPCSRRV